MVQKNLLEEFRIDLGSVDVDVLTIFLYENNQKNNEMFFDFEVSTDCIISQIFFWLCLFWFITD